MNSPKLRIFLVTSHISMIYATLLAKETQREGQKDILFIDAGKRRKGLLELLTQASGIYNWALFHDFSIPASDSLDYTPTFRQSVMRRIKNWPLISIFYGLLLKRHLKRQDRNYAEMINNVLLPFANEKKEVELFLLTQTVFNRPLQKLFPTAKINYLEHGLPDYFKVLEPGFPKSSLYCVFAEGYKNYLRKRQITTDWVKQLPGLNTFSEISAQLLAKHASTLQLDQLTVPDQPCVFVVMESVEMYNVKPSFPVDYMKRVLQTIPDPSRFHYILKPHPMQSQESISATVRHFQSLGYSFTLLNQASLSNASAEILFSTWKKNIEHVFCLFSAAGFYLSELYAGSATSFWYSTEFMSKHIDNAPRQYKDAFNKARPLIEEVFAEKCKTF